MIQLKLHEVVDGAAPNYLLNLFPQVREAHSHNSVSSLVNLTLVSSQMGKGSSNTSAPRIENRVPNSIKQTTNPGMFKIKLKHRLFD